MQLCGVQKQLAQSHGERGFRMTPLMDKPTTPERVLGLDYMNRAEGGRCGGAPRSQEAWFRMGQALEFTGVGEDNKCRKSAPASALTRVAGEPRTLVNPNPGNMGAGSRRVTPPVMSNTKLGYSARLIHPGKVKDTGTCSQPSKIRKSPSCSSRTARDIPISSTTPRGRS